MSEFWVSQSKVNCWRQCKQKYWLTYVEDLASRVKSRPLEFGGLFHRMLEEHIEGRRPLSVLRNLDSERLGVFAAERQMYGDLLQDIEWVWREYALHYKEDGLRWIKLDGARTEHEFEVEIAPGVWLIFIVDAFAKTLRGDRWLVDHKTGQSMMSPQQRWVNMQAAVYHKGCELLELPPMKGVCWNYIRSKPPTRPKLLQSGKLSTGKIDTLPVVVRSLVKEHGLKLREYRGLLSHAEENIPTWFDRDFVPLNRMVTESIFEDFMTTVNDMRRNHGKRREKEIGRHCTWCDFAPICRAELTGGDSRLIKRRKYVSRKEAKKQTS